MSENHVFGFSSIKTFLQRRYLNALQDQITFMDKTKDKKIVKKNLKMIENTFFMYLDKIKIKHLAEKSFSVPNGPPPNTIEHTKTFFWPNVLLFFLLITCKMYFLSFQDLFNTIQLDLINMCVTRKFFLAENPKTRFSDMKKIQKATKKFLRDLV